MTTNSKIRSDFEAWYCNKFTFATMARMTNGEYRGEHAFNAWITWQAALSQHQAKVSQPTNQTLLLQLLDSVSGDCYMGKEWEEEAARKLKLAAMEPKP